MNALFAGVAGIAREPVVGARRAARSTPVENDAVDTPDVVSTIPLPVTPVGVVHVLFEYSVNVTDPVGGTTDTVFWNVAVSPTVVGVPTVIDVGLACVVIVGLALVHTMVAGTAECVGGFVHVGS